MPLPPKRVPRRVIGTFAPPPAAPPVPIERLIEESRLIAHAAVRMSVKNAIIVGALREHWSFDSDHVMDLARSELHRLAKEQDLVARRDRSRSQRRAPVLHGLASALRADAADPDVLAGIVTRAREAAWDEVGEALRLRLGREATTADRLERDHPERDHPDEAERAERVAAFLALDLAALAVERGVELR